MLSPTAACDESCTSSHASTSSANVHSRWLPTLALIAASRAACASAAVDPVSDDYDVLGGGPAVVQVAAGETRVSFAATPESAVTAFYDDAELTLFVGVFEPEN